MSEPNSVKRASKGVFPCLRKESRKYFDIGLAFYKIEWYIYKRCVSDIVITTKKKLKLVVDMGNTKCYDIKVVAETTVNN